MLFNLCLAIITIIAHASPHYITVWIHSARHYFPKPGGHHVTQAAGKETPNSGGSWSTFHFALEKQNRVWNRFQLISEDLSVELSLKSFDGLWGLDSRIFWVVSLKTGGATPHHIPDYVLLRSVFELKVLCETLIRQTLINKNMSTNCSKDRSLNCVRTKWNKSKNIGFIYTF